MKQDSKSNKAVGITGTNGFIGSYLIAYFKKRNISYHVFLGDLLNKKELESFFQKNSVRQIIHLAGTFDPPFDNLITKNVLTTNNLLEIGIKHGLKKIIYASSGAVYGEPKNDTSKEKDKLDPNTLYGLTKKMAEECVRYYSSKELVTSIILRFPNVYGDNKTKGVIYHFLTDIEEKGYITIAGNGTQSRNFLHVSDACYAIEKALSYNKSNVFNISNNQKQTINDIVKKLSKKYSFKIKHKPVDNELNDLLLDTKKAQRELGFTAKINELII